jgi:alpha-glucosidase
MEKHSDGRNEERFGDADAFWHDVLCTTQKAMPDSALRISMNELSNHDHSRFLTRTNRVTGRAGKLGTEAALEGVNMQVMRQAVLIQMTWTGAPTIYYGDEAGLGGFTDPDNRRAYPWGHEDHALILYHRVLTGLRRTSRALRRGSLMRLPDADGLLAYARFTRGKSAEDRNRKKGNADGKISSGRESFIVLININHIPIDYQADITCAGVPPRAELECLLRTDRSGFNADPALLPKDARRREDIDTVPDERLMPVYISDGILRIVLPPESGILLRWKPDQEFSEQDASTY